MATHSEILSILVRIGTHIRNRRAGHVRTERDDKADELWFEVLKGLE